jgi:hypothetical protein
MAWLRLTCPIHLDTLARCQAVLLNKSDSLGGRSIVAAADELHRQELARLDATMTPRIEVLRSMTGDGLADELAAMFERLDHAVITTRPELVTVKAGRKYVIAWATPSDHAPVKIPAIRRLHQAVIAANAAEGIHNARVHARRRTCRLARADH